MGSDASLNTLDVLAQPLPPPGQPGEGILIEAQKAWKCNHRLAKLSNSPLRTNVNYGVTQSETPQMTFTRSSKLDNLARRWAHFHAFNDSLGYLLRVGHSETVAVHAGRACWGIQRCTAFLLFSTINAGLRPSPWKNKIT